MSLVGREDECRQLDQLLDSVRGGVAATLVLRGEPGIGKTALVDYAIEAASDMQTVVLVGIESEVGLGFGALQRVLVPIMHWIPRLPEPQQNALNAAFGKASGSYADPFLIGMAALSLAAESAARQPLLWVVDDAQWIDRESLNAFAFCGRRFAADPVALIFADRSTPEPEPVLQGFQVLTVSRLDAKDALSLFLERFLVMPDQGIAGRVIEETAGNPLALVELARAVSAGTLNEAWLAPEPLPLSHRLEERFLGTVRSLPADTQTWLLLVAADTTGDPSLLWKAAHLLALPPTAADSAEASQLLTLLPKVIFRHPLIRSAVYGGASPAQRRAVHAALADATDDHRDDNRRAWHRGAAAVAPDEDIALALERAAAHLGDRGGRTGESAFLSRAADLTPDPWIAARRRISAAESALAAGLPLQTQAQIDLIDIDGVDANLRSRVERARGSSWLLLRQPSRAAPILLAAATQMRDSDPQMRRRTLLEAVEAAFLSDFASVPLDRLAEAIEGEGQTVEASTIVEALLDGFATYVTQGYTAAVPALRHLIAVAQGDSVPRPELVRWAVFASHGASLLWDHDAHVALMARLIAACRQVGALSRLVDALQAAGASALRSGGLPVAELYFAEAAELGVAVDVPAASLAGFSLDTSARRRTRSTTEDRGFVVVGIRARKGLHSGSARPLAPRRSCPRRPSATTRVCAVGGLCQPWRVAPLGPRRSRLVDDTTHCGMPPGRSAKPARRCAARGWRQRAAVRWAPGRRALLRRGRRARCRCGRPRRRVGRFLTRRVARRRTRSTTKDRKSAVLGIRTRSGFDSLPRPHDPHDTRPKHRSIPACARPSEGRL